MDYSKYKFYSSADKVVAVSSYAGRTVRGVAKCSPRDEFDLETGKKLAAMRCEAKIAEKRMKRAFREHDAAIGEVKKAAKRLAKMEEYEADATARYNEANLNLESFMSEI